MKILISKQIQEIVHLRPFVPGRCIGHKGRPLDHPIFIIYSSSGRIVDVFSLSWLRHMATHIPSYFDSFSTELRFFF